MAFSLLTTKLYVPPPRTELVPRPRLLNRLTTSLNRRPGVVLVSAPAGFGKTTLVSNWLKTLPAAPAPIKPVWLSLDDGDNDLTRFLTYLIAALQQANPAIGQLAQTMLYTDPAQLPSPQAVVTTLINDLTAEADARLVLVLDDYHVIDNHAIDQTLAFLIEHQPPQLHLVLTSRIDPDLPLARLRARSQLTELRTADLRFTAGEAAAFLNQLAPMPLSANDVAALEARTEGWIAGLQLAALSMQNSSDIGGFIAAFTGSHRYIMDYLADEVLDQQPEAIKTFLLQTSLLDRLTASLCNAVTGQDTGQRMLEELEAANLFLIPLDNERRWYRYHHLFAELLRQRLRAQTPAAVVAGLHRRAAEWYEQQADQTKEPELVTQSLHHALPAGNIEQAIRLISKFVESNLMAGNITTVKNWLEQFPPELVRMYPQLSMSKAWVMYFSQQPETAELLLNYAEERVRQMEISQPVAEIAWAKGEISMLRAWVVHSQGHLDRAIELFHQAIDQLPETRLRSHGLSLLFLAGVMFDKDEVALAINLLKQSITICKSAGNNLAVMGGSYGVSRLLAIQGQLQQARATLEQALTWATTQNLRQMPSMGELYLGLGEILYEQNWLTEAEEYLHTSLEVAQRGMMITPLPCSTHFKLVLLHLAHHDIEGAREHLTQADELQHLPEAAKDNLELEIRRVDALLALARHDTDSAEMWLQQAVEWLQKTDAWAGTGPPINRLLRQTTAANILVAQAGHGQKIDAATLGTLLQALKQLGQEAATAGRMGQLIDILALQALALTIQGHPAEALAALRQALTLAEPEGYIRTFVDKGPLLAGLLAQAQAQNITPAYTRRLLAQFPAAPGSTTITPGPVVVAAPQLIEALSERELEVLRLVAAGLSNQDIASELVLATSTVKRHMSNVYGKLNVTSRTQAIAEARALGLL